MLGRLGGVTGSVVIHSILALVACISLTEGLRGTGRGSSNAPGNGEGAPGVASTPLEVGIREGRPDLEPSREPDTILYERVIPADTPEAELPEEPPASFDAFSTPDLTAPVFRESRPFQAVDRPTPRPPGARELLPKGLPGGTGVAPEGSLVGTSAPGEAPGVTGAGGSGRGTGSGGSGDGSLVAVYSPKPEYPASARRRSIEGVSVVEITIDSAGAVTDAKLVRSSACEALDRSALETVKKWKYERKSSGGPLPPLTERIRFVFRLSD